MCEYMDVSKCYHHVLGLISWLVLYFSYRVLDSVLLSVEQVSFRSIFIGYCAINTSFILNMDIINYYD